MAILVQNGTPIFTVSNVVIWVGTPGKAAFCGGSFVTTPGIPSIQLLPSTNTVLGYWNGNMLAYAAGDGSGIYADLTAGALVNWDANSSDTGQKVWNGMIVCDPGLTEPFTINSTTLGKINLAVPKAGWEIRQQFLYGGGTPSTDATDVAAAILGIATSFLSFTPSGTSATEQTFTY